MKKFVLCALIFFIVRAEETDSPTVYSRIQALNLSSLTWLEEDWPHETFHEYLIRCLQYQLHLQPFKKRRTVFKLFHKLASKSPQSEHKYLYDLTTAQDLNLFCGPNAGDPYLADIIARTKTELGRVFLYGLIASPTEDITELTQRQEIIKTIVQDPALYADLHNCFTHLADCENILYSFWAQDGFVQSTERHYFSIPYLNKVDESLNTSEVALGIRSLTNHGRRAFYLSLGVAASALFPLYGFYKLRDAQLPPLLQDAANFLQGSGGRILGFFSNHSNKIIAGAATVAAGIYLRTWLAGGLSMDSRQCNH